MNERLDRFTKLLKEIFELDKSDLDFGIYRVMNLRKAQIEQFLTERLPKMVQETLAPFAQGSKEEIRAKMKQIEESVAEMGMTVDALPNTAQKKQQYLQLQKQLAEGADLAALETDVYSALYSFFNRYYEDGDFISKRRYKEGVYAIPYEGEEVKLYWANQDQYYIKTSENFKDYTFVFDGINVHFRLVDATTEQNNNKESKDNKRAFMLFREDEEIYPGIKTFEYDPDTAEIVIRFVYDIPEDKKKKYTEENYARITEWLLSQRRAELNPLIAPIPTGKGRETTTLLEKHLKGYVAKNTFDYFIHKDLHGFLTRELDFFIKSEVMHLEDLDTGSEARVETYLAKVKAVKRVGKIIIDFLAQIENFQKKLWLKKKFVVETNWCVTLDKIDESFWPEIIGNETTPKSLGFSESKLKRYPLVDEIGHFSWMNFIRAGNNDLRTDRPKLYYPIAVAADDSLRVLNMTWNEGRQEYSLLETPKNDEILVYPVKYQNGVKIEKNWQRGHERMKREIPLGEYRARRTDEGISIDFKTRMDEEAMPTTWWEKNEYASANYAPTELKELFGEKPFDFAKARTLVQDAICACGGTKSTARVLDFFAGSATTGDAVIQLNRIDDGKRKYILVEMGEYFSRVTKPRMQKVAYAAEWKDGKPQNRTTGVPQIIKYMRLESYEDALSNIQLSDNGGQFKALLGEDYMIHYMVDLESRGSLLDVEAFANPFAYTMKITEKNECKERPVDLMETFNYLIGLTIARQSAISYWLSKPAKTPVYEGAVELVSDISGQYAFRQIEGTLPDGRRALVIWRTVTDDIIASNAALDAYFTTHRKDAEDRKYDVIFVNGDNNLENLRGSSEGWTVRITEIEFKNRMFEEV